MELCLDTATSTITDEKGNVVSLDNAKAFWLDGKVTDCSLSFERLANFDFNLGELEAFYDKIND